MVTRVGDKGKAIFVNDSCDASKMILMYMRGPSVKLSEVPGVVWCGRAWGARLPLSPTYQIPRRHMDSGGVLSVN